MTGANAGEITGVVVSIKGSSMKRQMKRKKSCKQGGVTLAVRFKQNRTRWSQVEDIASDDGVVCDWQRWHTKMFLAAAVTLPK